MHTGPPAASGLHPFHVLVKPTGARCNLACSYCFYSSKAALYPGSASRMSDRVLESFLRQLLAAHPDGPVTVAWQGGEPTLMGLDFFARAVELAARLRRPGQHLQHTFQTNGVLLDDRWCELFVAHDFLVGLSLDGPAALHDTFRRDKAGHPSFEATWRGASLLRKHGVRFNALATVNHVNAEKPLEVYRFLRDELGAEWLQFIPVVERVSRAPDSRVSAFSVRPEQLGRFLNTVFDEWARHDVGKVFVQGFEAAARNWLGLPSGLCLFSPTCGLGLALEHNGDLYACDHFVEPGFLLGNLEREPLGALVGSERQRRFGRDKLDRLPRQCLECEVRFACHGECPKNRFLSTSDGEPGLNYLCAGYRSFFRHIARPMALLAGLLRRGRPAAELMGLLAAEAGGRRQDPNERCACGSGRKFKRCHGAAKAAARDDTGAGPRPGSRGR